MCWGHFVNLAMLWRFENYIYVFSCGGTVIVNNSTGTEWGYWSQKSVDGSLTPFIKIIH